MIRALLALFVVIGFAYSACGGNSSTSSDAGGGSRTDSGELEEPADAGLRTIASIGTEPTIVGSMPYANGFWAPTVEGGQLRFLWAREGARLEYFERSFVEGGVGDGVQPVFTVETPFTSEKSINAVRTNLGWRSLPLFVGANPNRYPLRYLFWTPAQQPVVAMACDYGHQYAVGASESADESWIAFEEPCSDECGPTKAAVLHRVPLQGGEPQAPMCLFEEEAAGYSRRILLHPEFRMGATFLERTIRLFEFSSETGLVSEATASEQRLGIAWLFWPGEKRLIFQHRPDVHPSQFVPPEIREARVVGGQLEIRISALDPLFMAVQTAIATTRGVLVAGQPKPSVDGSGRQLVALVRDGTIIGQQLLPDLGPRQVQLVELEGSLFVFMEGRVSSDAGSSEAPIYGFRLSL